MTTGEGDDLALSLARRDPGAFEQLIAAYQDRLFNFVLRYLGAREDAEEVVQDAFVRAHRAVYRRMTTDRVATLALTPWLYRIALNVARNHTRRRRIATVDLAQAEQSADRTTAVPLSLRADPPAEAERTDLAAALRRELLRLPERYRAAVVLRLVEGLSYDEVATALGQPVGTVKSSVHRGAKLMRPGLSAWYEGSAT